MAQARLILVCAHRGSNLDREADFLGYLGFRVRSCGSLRRSLKVLEEERPALAIVDPLSREGTAELCALDRARGEPPVPLLVLAEREDEEAMLRAARALERPGWDVVWRGAPLEELKLRIDRLLEGARRAEEMDDLRHQASHDDRTDLLRPRTFQGRLTEHFGAAQRHELALALVLIDLDRFGAINKRHDHTVGDALIARVGEAIRRTVRTEDVAGRLGGDEFGVLLPYTGKIDAALVVKRLREEIAKLSFTPPGAGEPIQVSASLGFETFDGSDLDSVETLRRHAERALRHAKRSGGDQGIYYRSLSPEERGA